MVDNCRTNIASNCYDKKSNWERYELVQNCEEYTMGCYCNWRPSQWILE